MPSSFDALQRYLTEHRDELSPLSRDSQAFERELASLTQFWGEEKNVEFASTETWRVLAEHPVVAEELKRRGFEEPRASGAPVVETARRAEEGTESQQSRAAAEAVAPLTSQDGAAEWERRLAIGRELVAGCIALLIILASMVPLVVSVFRVSEASRAATRDAFLFLNGLLGVVLGYYFGRTPGETRAERADAAAAAAKRELDRSLTEVEKVLDSAATSVRGAEDAWYLTPEQVQRLRTLVRLRR